MTSTRSSEAILACVFGLMLLASRAVGTDIYAYNARIQPRKAPTILFMCPHGAAKSVLASAYFLRRAKQRGLNVHVVSAGTEPDPAVAPAVAAHLVRQGYTVPITVPQKVSQETVASADVVVSIGCDLTGLPVPKGTLVKWDDVPSPSQNFTGADDAIRKRVAALIGNSRRIRGFDNPVSDV